jgi:hypothetical protein
VQSALRIGACMMRQVERRESSRLRGHDLRRRPASTRTVDFESVIAAILALPAETRRPLRLASRSIDIGA